MTHYQPGKPSESEDEYFARLELEKKRRWAKEHEATLSPEQKQDARDQHFMKCPKCGMELHSVEMKGFKLDQCVSCGGSWLDAGEMEQLLAHEHPILNRLKHVFGAGT